MAVHSVSNNQPRGVITVSTDGSCLANPGGAIGWAWVDHLGTRFDSGGAPSGTNQVAELTAVLEAVRSNPGPAPLLIESDSQYAIRCASEWLPGWKRKGWRTAAGGEIKNLALVKAIDAAISGREGPVRFRWVRGHIGHPFNERADQLAGIAARDWAAGRGVIVGALIADDDEAPAAPEGTPSGAAGALATAAPASPGTGGPAQSAGSESVLKTRQGIEARQSIETRQAGENPPGGELRASLVEQIFASVTDRRPAPAPADQPEPQPGPEADRRPTTKSQSAVRRRRPPQDTLF